MRKLLFGVALMGLSLAALAAPKSELWQRWAASSQTKVAIDHSDWDAFLQAYVKPGKDGINRVAYGKVNKSDRAALDRYVANMQGVAITKFSRPEQRAYWINLYNATTVKTILEHYPVESIMKISISPGFFAKGPWGKKQLKVEGEDVSLDDIEHRVLRPIWKDPRTHYSVNCASIGCPNLATHAYTASNMEDMLNAGATAYVNSSRGASVAGGKLTVSSIYKWFQGDFGADDAAVIEHLKKYAEPALAKKLSGITRISGDAYSWDLNDAIR